MAADPFISVLLADANAIAAMDKAGYFSGRTKASEKILQKLQVRIEKQEIKNPA